MYKYKENDYVKCTNIVAENHEKLTVGEIYLVRSVTHLEHGVVYGVEDMLGVTHYSIDRFELVAREDADIYYVDPINACEPIDISREAEQFDVVLKPKHYNSGRYEVIDVIEDFTRDLKGIEAVCVGNVIKYVGRYPYKNGLEDLKKAQFYLNKIIGRLED